MENTPQDRELEDAIRSIGKLHGNMAVLSKLDALLKSADTDVSEPERLIQSDGAISASIVQIANSPLYGFSEKSDNIAAALQKVGYTEALKLVSMALSRQVFMRDLASYGVSADSYWRYSYFTATFLERQAARLGRDKDEAYLLGLLHSIGRVVINELLHAQEIEVFWDRFIPEQSWEQMTIGFTNQKAGATLLRIWGFPDSIVKRVALQNSPELIRKDASLSLLDYARSLALNLIDSKRLDAFLDPDAHPAQKILRLSPEALLEEVHTVRSSVEEVYNSLKDCES